MSVLKLLFTCILILSFGIFLVYLETERTRMEHKILKWEKVRDTVQESLRKEVYFKTELLQKKIHGESLYTDLLEMKKNNLKWSQ